MASLGKVREPTLGEILGNANIQLQRGVDQSLLMKYQTAERYKISQMPKKKLHEVRVMNNKKEENEKLTLLREYLVPADGPEVPQSTQATAKACTYHQSPKQKGRRGQNQQSVQPKFKKADLLSQDSPQSTEPMSPVSAGVFRQALGESPSAGNDLVLRMHRLAAAKPKEKKAAEPIVKTVASFEK